MNTLNNSDAIQNFLTQKCKILHEANKNETVLHASGADLGVALVRHLEDIISILTVWEFVHKKHNVNGPAFADLQKSPIFEKLAEEYSKSATFKANAANSHKVELPVLLSNFLASLTVFFHKLHIDDPLDLYMKVELEEEFNPTALDDDPKNSMRNG